MDVLDQGTGVGHEQAVELLKAAPFSFHVIWQEIREFDAAANPIVYIERCLVLCASTSGSRGSVLGGFIAMPRKSCESRG